MHAQGLVPLEGHEGETMTRGLEHLEVNCQEYYRYHTGSADVYYVTSLLVPNVKPVLMNVEEWGALTYCLPQQCHMWLVDKELDSQSGALC